MNKFVPTPYAMNRVDDHSNVAARIKRRQLDEATATEKVTDCNRTFVMTTRQTFMDDIRHYQCRWPMTKFEGRTVCCGMPVVDKAAREGRREKTHCQGHLDVSNGCKRTGLRLIKNVQGVR